MGVICNTKGVFLGVVLILWGTEKAEVGDMITGTGEACCWFLGVLVAPSVAARGTDVAVVSGRPGEGVVVTGVGSVVGREVSGRGMVCEARRSYGRGG